MSKTTKVNATQDVPESDDIIKTKRKVEPIDDKWCCFSKKDLNKEDGYGYIYTLNYGVSVVNLNWLRGSIIRCKRKKNKFLIQVVKTQTLHQKRHYSIIYKQKTSPEIIGEKSARTYTRHFMNIISIKIQR